MIHAGRAIGLAALLAAYLATALAACPPSEQTEPLRAAAAAALAATAHDAAPCPHHARGSAPEVKLGAPCPCGCGERASAPGAGRLGPVLPVHAILLATPAAAEPVLAREPGIPAVPTAPLDKIPIAS